MRRAILAAIALVLSIQSTPAHAGSVMAKVIKATNGNTITVQIDGKEMEVRLLGVATPDPNDKTPILKELGIQASAFLGEYLKASWVMLEYPTGKPEPDANGVVDAYVYRGKDAVFVNEKIIREGFGITNRKVACSYRANFIAVEDKAKEAQRGIWSPTVEADGKRAGSGKEQMAYLGRSGNNTSSRSAVDLWIIIFY
jgi:endonuclease YncB( thermonuclease family)